MAKFNEGTNTLLYKNRYISHFILERVDILWCVRDEWRNIYSERELLPISSSRSHWVAMLAPPCKLVRDASGRQRVPRSTAILCTLSKSHQVVLLPVIHLFDLSALIVLSCLLIKTWLRAKHTVSPKIHSICYITLILGERITLLIPPAMD